MTEKSDVVRASDFITRNFGPSWCNSIGPDGDRTNALADEFSDIRAPLERQWDEAARIAIVANSQAVRYMNERDAAIARIAVLEEEKESWSAEDDRMERRIATLTEALNTASCDMADVRNALIRTEQALGGAQVRLCAVIAGYNTEEGK